MLQLHTRVESAWLQCLKLNQGQLPSSFADTLNVRPCTAVIATSLKLARVPPPLLRPTTNLQRIQHLLYDVFYTVGRCSLTP